jgi:ABC-type glycerol-3-phosphate transport system permease component
MVYAVLGIYLAWLVIPILWGILSSFREGGASLFEEGFLRIRFEDFTLRHYEYVLKDPYLLHFFQNSLYLAGLSSLCTTALASLGGYGLSRFQLRGKEALLTTIFSSRMFPFALLLLPIFVIFFALKLVDTYWGVLLAHIVLAIPFAIWVAKACFDKIPRELEEAALTDGCSRLLALRKIFLPLATPGVVVIAFYAFAISWGDYLMVSLLTSSQKTQTLPISLANLIQGTAPWETILVMTVFSIIPPILFFASIQRWFVSGLSTGVMK